MLDFINKDDCTGCTACYSVCPVNCITMVKDNEGFNYPEVDKSRCIECGKCKRVCPILNKKTNAVLDIEQYAVAGVSKNNKVWKKSTSGGAFTEICNAFGDSETIVFGVRFDGLKVLHSYVKGVENIAPFRKSKYVESDLGNSFRQVQDFLENGSKVIFSGTPCQIAGLNQYLNKKYENLLLVDFVCHGVGSPFVFEAVLKHTELVTGKKIKKYSFRNQVGLLGNILDFVGKFEYADGKTKYVFKDLYYRLFLTRLCIRPSCAKKCQFKHTNRISDITIADLKGKSNILPNNNDYKNYSTIIFNSEKGNTLYQKLNSKMKLYPILTDDISKYNSHFSVRRACNPRRDMFFKSFVEERDKRNLFNEYYQVGNTSSVIIKSWKDLIPYKLKQTIKKYLIK